LYGFDDKGHSHEEEMADAEDYKHAAQEKAPGRNQDIGIIWRHGNQPSPTIMISSRK
jgi:hypothetical protein